MKAVHPEPGVRPTRELGRAVAEAIHDLAAWSGVGRVDLVGPAPDRGDGPWRDDPVR